MPIPACDPPAIYHRAYLATGGRQWRDAKQISYDGVVFADGQRGPIRVTVDLRDGRSLSASSIGGRSTAYFNDGKAVWYRDHSGGVHPFDSQNARMAAVTDAYIARRGYFNPGDRATMRCIGRKRAGADAISITPAGGLTFEQLVDPASHLIVQTIRHTPTDTVYEAASDFREYSGLVLPFSIVRRSTGNVEVQHIRRYAVSNAAPHHFEPPAPLPNAGLVGSAARTTIPLSVERGDVIVEAFVNGRGPLSFLLDTGGHFILTPQAARRLGLHVAGAGTSGGGGSGLAQTSYALVDELRLGAAYLKHQPVVVIDYDNDFSDRGKRAPLAGILGLEVFERFVTTIDYGSKTLTLFDPASFARPKDASCIPITFQYDMPLADAAADGAAGPFGIDTGNSGTPILFGPFLQRTGLLRNYTGGVASTGYGTGGSVSFLSETMRAFAFGGLTFAHLPVSFVIGQHGGSFSSTTEAGNLGYFVLAHFVPTFDYARGLLYLGETSNRPPPAYNRTGLSLQKGKHDAIDVLSVRPGSPGAQPGIRSGDQITAIDGVPASDLGVGDIYTIVRGPAGTVLTLTIRRKSDVKTTHVTLRVLHAAPVVTKDSHTGRCER